MLVIVDSYSQFLLLVYSVYSLRPRVRDRSDLTELQGRLHSAEKKGGTIHFNSSLMLNYL